MKKTNPTTTQAINLGALLSDSIKASFINIIPFLIITTLVMLPSLIWNYLDHTKLEEVPKEINFMQRYCKVWLAMLLYLISQSAMCYGVVQYLLKRRAPILQCLKKGLGRILPVIGVAIVSYLLIWLGFICLIIPGLILMCALAVVIPVAVMEKRGITGSISRSFNLTKGSRFKIFLAFLLMGIIVFIFAFIVLSITFATFGTGDFNKTSTVNLVVTEIIRLFMGVAFAVMCSVTYARLREKNEGMKAEELAIIFE